MPRIVSLLRTYAGRHRSFIESRGPQTLLRLLAVALLASVSVGSASAGIVARGTGGGTAQAAEVTAGVAAQRTDDVASRSQNRATGQAAAPAAAAPSTKANSAVPAPAAKAAPATPAAPAAPATVAGLTAAQTAHAATIVSVGEQMQLPKRAYIVAMATALQESKLSNLANWNSTLSMAIPHDGVGGDWDSVGLFQQRPSTGWGTTAELMTPAISARRFYAALAQVPDWTNLPITVAAQDVQGSAFPDAYADDEALATQIVDALAP
jgi:hypothetical protein